MKRIVRDYRALCRAEGVELLGIEHRSRHYALVFERGFVIAPATPSARRGMLHLRAEIRRFHA